MTKKKTKKAISSKINQETILLLCAHPDDEILGAGGTIAKYTSEGKKVVTVIFSYGENSHWWLQKKYTVAMRVKESKAAGEVVGTSETIFLGLKDFELKNEIAKKTTIEMIKKIIKKYDPSKIFTHSPDDMIYPDHLAVWAAVEQATKSIKYKGDIYVFNIWAKDIRVAKNPKLIVDISKEFRKKWEALKCFRSQHMYIFQLYPGVFWKALKYGWENKTRFAESFTKIK